MPSIKKKFVGFIRQFSNPNSGDLKTDNISVSDSSACFIRKYLNGESKQEQPEILNGRTGDDLPSIQLATLKTEVFAAFTGPDRGLTTVNRKNKALVLSQDTDVSFIDSDDEETSIPPAPAEKETTVPDEQEEIAGILDWNRAHGNAYGISTSLYERHPISGEVAGSPIADAFAIIARGNNAILVLADGVNWGEKAALAARSAIHGCVDYLNKALFITHPSNRKLNTSDIFLSLLRSFHAAHNMILQEGGLLTTLTVAVVAELHRPSAGAYGSSKFAVCVCNVGDSLAYVYSSQNGVREITQGSHDVHSMRDMRDALGALGPVDGQNPELNNLTCSMTLIDDGDIVFLTSDGISDNFDPVVGKFVVARKPDRVVTNPTNGRSHTSLPAVEAFQRHELTLLRMEDIIRNGTSPSVSASNSLTAQQLCQDMMDFATRLTSAKRRLLEDAELYVDDTGRTLEKEEQKTRRRKICERMALIPGKLDHATIVAFKAGIWSSSEGPRESTI